MTKKHFIALADHLQRAGINRYNATFDRDGVLNVLANFCQSQNPRFNRSRWLGYIKGDNGPNGGRVKP